MITIGVLSDSHLHQATDLYQKHCSEAFASCEVILHAGDLTNLSVLEPFSGKKIYAVSGNMCAHQVQQLLPKERRIQLEGITIGLSHGEGERSNIEDRVFAIFPEADCIVYGHTHIPVCHKYGHTLMVNPGSFQATSRYGSTGTYAILTVDGNNISGEIHSLPQ